MSADGVMYNVGKWGALVSMVLFLVTFSSGLATIPWLINSEIYPIFLVGTASSIAAFTNWITNFIMTSAFFSSNYVITLAVTAGITIVFWFFIYFFLKETRGNSIRKNVALLLNKTIHDANRMVDKSQAKIMMASVPSTPIESQTPTPDGSFKGKKKLIEDAHPVFSKYPILEREKLLQQD